MQRNYYKITLCFLALLLSGCGKKTAGNAALQGTFAPTTTVAALQGTPAPTTTVAASQGTPVPTATAAAPQDTPTAATAQDTPAPSPTDTPTAATAQNTPAPSPTDIPTDTPKNFPQAGEPFLENLIATALLPVGSTMYIWGGGWNEADTGSGPEALSIGVSERWENFYAKQDKNYDFNQYRYFIHDGLDCSGYVGWVLYNLFHKENSTSEEDGYVMKSTIMAETFAGYGWGDLLLPGQNKGWKPGDICSMSGHVWICLGTCEDGSVLLVHSIPPGVTLSGTLSEDGSRTDAVALAEKWMSSCYPEWYDKFSECGVEYSYLTKSKQMRWNQATLSDARSFQALSAEEIAKHFMKQRP